MFLVMAESEAIQKSMTVGKGTNSYKAVSEASMLNLIKPLFKKNKLIIFPIEGDIKDHVSVWEKTDTYKGTVKNDLRAVTELKVFYKIVDIESGESEILVGFGNGADPQDKGAGKALTYSFKNVLSKTFMLFSGEDTDNTHSDDIGKDKPDKTLEPDKAPDELKTGKDPVITRAQQLVFFKITKNVKVAKEILQKHKYTSSSQIKSSEYQTICEELKAAAIA